MGSLFVTQALPNPAGKDRSSYGAANDQLNREWVEFKNVAAGAVEMNGISIVHRTFDAYCTGTGYVELTGFTSGTLASGKSVRVHTGAGTNFWEGDALFHFYLGRQGYVWNNRCGDTVVIQSNGSNVDWAAYSPNPGEGRILTRVYGENRLA